MKNIKVAISTSINKIHTKFPNFTNFFKRAFTYTYCVEEKELKDRIIFRDNYIAELEKEKMKKG